jgi:16S rRNA (guanine966-N2)-methyltransferase
MGSEVVDLFAGTGALGLEAWSRGAKSVCLVENQRGVVRVLKENVRELCGARATAVRVVAADVFRFLRAGGSGPSCDLILADPPYVHSGEGEGLARVLAMVRDHSCLAPGGLLVYEQAVRDRAVQAEGWDLVREKRYGKTRLLFYRLQGEAGGVDA